MFPVPNESLLSIQGRFHDVIRERCAHLEGFSTLKLPDLHPSNRPDDPKVWFPVSGMYGGFAYWWDEEAVEPKLITESWCRVVEGSEQRHEITTDGSQLVAEGFAACSQPDEWLDDPILLLRQMRAFNEGALTDVAKLIANSDLCDLSRQYEDNLAKRVIDVGLNLFVLISDTYHRENFHSDIISLLLNPASPHKEGDKYLKLFLEFLRRHPSGKRINASHFGNASVVREKHRIDLYITDADSKKAIIIENKIYNAPDAYKQLPRYLTQVENEGYECEAIVYLRLNSLQQPDRTNWNEEERERVNDLLITITAFNDSEDDLVNGWLLKCERASQNIDALFLCRQYGTLIKKLGGDIMNKPIMEQFYAMMLAGDNFKTALSVKAMLQDLIIFRVEMIVDYFRIDTAPFEKIGNHKNYDAFFDGLYWNDAHLGIDVIVEETLYSLNFWDKEDRGGVHGKARLALERMSILSDYSLKEGGVYVKEFSFPSGCEALIAHLAKFKQELSIITNDGAKET